MRGWLAVVALVACGSSDSGGGKADARIDVPRVDAAIDAPAGSGCVAAPFTGQPTVIGTATTPMIGLPQSLAFAVSTGSTDNSLYLEQPPSAAAAVIAAFTASSTQGWDYPALRPDGNELFARELNTNTIWSSINTGGVWQAPVQQTGAWFSDSLASTPFAVGTTGDVRMMIWDDIGMQEYARTGTTWTALGSALTSTQLIGQAGNIAMPSLTPDGLSLVFLGSPGALAVDVRYAHRDSVDAAFTLPATPIYTTSAPPIESPYLTANCADLYLVQNEKLVRFGP